MPDAMPKRQDAGHSGANFNEGADRHCHAIVYRNTHAQSNVSTTKHVTPCQPTVNALTDVGSFIELLIARLSRNIAAV